MRYLIFSACFRKLHFLKGVFQWLRLVGTIKNVHGTCANKDIIFGVDATARLSPGAHIFTKTCRKMLQKNTTNMLLKNVKTIKFYGHSLGEADYSYFQSLFDRYNLYGDSPENTLALQFYFTIFDEKKEAEIIRDATDSVYNVITVYGTTLDNKDKGKNLLHKLLLEGRVQIKFLPNIQHRE